MAVLAHQALFGYEDGHRLLASSDELSPADRRLLVRQTDSPDAGKVQGWAELLAGYPLPSGLFALTLTWPAPEMPRPGCVWTHALLFTEEALGAIDPPSVPLSFRRPTGPIPDRSAYRKRV